MGPGVETYTIHLRELFYVDKSVAKETNLAYPIPYNEQNEHVYHKTTQHQRGYHHEGHDYPTHNAYTW